MYLHYSTSIYTDDVLMKAKIELHTLDRIRVNRIFFASYQLPLQDPL